ncbi:helix-turn-helix transcriptional regulator [Enterobacter roggenkampii]|uniref:helix-turn-helix domain-containing protein n=1 Tax=Enterobacter TaxID=547 RepID=UPI0015F3D9C3|nr:MULTISPECIES: helix-turn-helix transcriptional regulator [Enterobacter]EKU9177011.1 helix-turn-helix transcriptional regulator [Enterobacter roggenkampii MGH 34]HED2515606.1 helix-turn-helix transcriptional regulator [Enterobacter asburiae]EKW7743712.1 helix-turn-helix transcriptional regulator [Enterobacter roggenkampii]ELN9573289.1 helix-turn-helix transcriptional regulator [Enterobacter roggenkampii]EMD2718452.1 helix-turn-helix transcriptional regulator [Enterobacter roggenkampii]
MAYNWNSSIDYVAIGERLKAYRIGASLQAEDVAEQLGVSRAVIYRIERGDIVKIETLDRLAQVLETSLASLLGVESEYYPTALGLFERMRQLESVSDRILAHFEPVSLLLTSDSYLDVLRKMLKESKTSKSHGEADEKNIDAIISILIERRTYFEQRKPHIISLVGLRELERFIHTGMVGRLDLPEDIYSQRVKAARHEVIKLADLMESEPLDIQIGIIDEAMPSSSFQVLSGPSHSVMVTSPFRLGEMPNVYNGIGTVTYAPEAVKKHEDLMIRLWRKAHKGREGADLLRKLLKDIC